MLAKTLVRFLRNERGATAIEYGLMAGLVAVALIASFVAFGDAVVTLFGMGGAGELIGNRALSIN